MLEYYIFAVFVLALAAGICGARLFAGLNVTLKVIVCYMLFSGLAAAASYFSSEWYGSNLVLNKLVLLVNTVFVIGIFYPCFRKIQSHKTMFAVIYLCAFSLILILTVPDLFSPVSFPSDAVLVYNVFVTFCCLLYYHVVLLSPSLSAIKLMRNTEFIAISGFFFYHAGSIMYWMVMAFAQSGGNASMTVAYFNAFLVLPFYTLILFAFGSRLAANTPHGINR